MLRGIIPAVVGCLLISFIFPAILVYESPTTRHIQMFVGFAGIYSICAVWFIGYAKRLVCSEQTSRDTTIGVELWRAWQGEHTSGAGD